MNNARAVQTKPVPRFWLYLDVKAVVVGPSVPQQESREFVAEASIIWGLDGMDASAPMRTLLTDSSPSPESRGSVVN
jgi:hypothetical protein